MNPSARYSEYNERVFHIPVGDLGLCVVELHEPKGHGNENEQTKYDVEDVGRLAAQVLQVIQEALCVYLLSLQEQNGQTADEHGQLGYVAHPCVGRAGWPLS